MVKLGHNHTGYIQIRIPDDLEESISNRTLKCQGLYGMLNPTLMQCQMIRSLPFPRILVRNSFPNSLKSIAFIIEGLTNPDSERRSGSFRLQSFDANNSLLESSLDGLYQLQAVRGALSSIVLSSDNQQVGQYGTLIGSFRTQNIIPFNGQVRITVPKWNPDSQVRRLSHFNLPSNSTSQRVDCRGMVNIRPNMVCTVTQGDIADVLTITYAFERAVEANSIIQFNITEFRNPPSTDSINLIQIQTLDSTGNVVDHADGGRFKISLPALVPASNVRITPQLNTINAITNYDITYRLQNPAPAGSILIIIFPPQVQVIAASSGDIYLTQVSQIGKQEGFINFRIQQQTDGSTKVVLQDAISSYVEQGSNIFLRFTRIMNSVSQIVQKYAGIDITNKFIQLRALEKFSFID